MKRFDERFLRQLENLRLAVRKSVRGRKEGERSTSRKGGASEFVSHRDYQVGDDLRSIDWPLYARLGELFVRQFSREECFSLHLVVDGTPSMRIEAGEKYELALRLAAGLGAVAWAESSRVFFRGVVHENLGSLLSALERESGAFPDPEKELSALSRSTNDSGLVVLLSDLWEDSIRTSLVEASRCGDVVLLHLLSPSESSPRFEGRYRLVDSETSEVIDRHVGEEEVALYLERLTAHCASWKKWCLDHEMNYVPCSSDDDWSQILIRTLREAGLYR